MTDNVIALLQNYNLLLTVNDPVVNEPIHPNVQIPFRRLNRSEDLQRQMIMFIYMKVILILVKPMILTPLTKQRLVQKIIIV